MSESNRDQGYTPPFWCQPTELAELAGQLGAAGEGLQRALQQWAQRTGGGAWSPGAAAEAVLRVFPALKDIEDLVQPWPILGLAPEHQRRAQEFVRHYLAWQQAQLAHQAFIQEAMGGTLRDFQQGLAALPASAPQDELTELAARCLEHHHRALLNDEGYIEALGQAQQSTARLQAAALELIRPLWNELGLATRDDLLGLRQRQREEMDGLRRELAELRQCLRRHDDALTND